MLRGRAPIEVGVEIRNLGQILRDVKAFQPKLATGIRREIRNAAKVAAKAAQDEVRGGGQSSTGLREGIARGIRVSISTGARSSGVRIVSSGSGLDASRKPMVKAYNSPSFRHPVFGNANRWVTQAGRPYFGSVIARHKGEVQQGIERALDDALAVIETRY